jgi:hypothetical protein
LGGVDNASQLLMKAREAGLVERSTEGWVMEYRNYERTALEVRSAAGPLFKEVPFRVDQRSTRR